MSRDLIGAVLAAILFAIGLTTWGPQLISAQSIPVENVEATHAVQIAVAANQYISNPTNYAALLTATASGPVAITVAQLQAAPGYYLNATFIDQSPFQQTHVVLVYNPVGTQLKALVVGIGGRVIPETTLNRLAALADSSNNSGTGGLGGAIHVTNALTSSLVATAAIGDWKEPLANYAVNGYSLTPGHLAILLNFDGTNVISPFLDRYPVPNQPDANRMHAAIDMNSNAINNASDVYLNGMGRFLSNAPLTIAMVAPGTIITKPTCPTAGQTPAIFVTPAAGSDNGVGGQISAFNYWADDTPGDPTTWTVLATITTQNGTITPDAQHGLAQVMTACSGGTPPS